MVRMDHPSPFQVGREFVRQYYSLLNKAPEILHRFYGVNSSYVHGSRYLNGEPEEEVVGQSAIHSKIISLQFKECHTKVYQVDAHSTIGNGVVVQVIGELSNNRQPLRRFMQTFVLAPQGDNPYKFYVHNDIFRYEDEVYRDELPPETLGEEEQGSDVEDHETHLPLPPQAQFDNHVGIQNQTQHVVNNDIMEQRLESPDSTDNRPSPAISASPANVPSADSPTFEPIQDPTPMENEQRADSPDYPSQDENLEPESDLAQKETSEITDAVSAKENESNQVFSWAALASKNMPAQHNIQQGTVVKVNQSNDGVVMMDQQKPPPRNTRPPPPAQREDPGDAAGDGSSRRVGTRYPDNQQIFVGNLPYEITDVDLREHFSEFGEIIDVRINHSHTSNPSFGFIIFEEQKSVEEVLRQMPTNFKNNKRINIEEKKQRTMPRDGRRDGPGRWDGRRENNRGGRLQQRGPPRRDWGGSREGQRPNNFQPRR